MGKFKFYFLWLSLICIIVFVLQLIIPGFTDLFVLNLKAVYEQQYWRFLTAIFLHGSAIHLVYNLFALIFFGLALEKLIGGYRFLILFLVSGIIANVIAVNFYSSSLGASGAIYGIIGCLAILNPFMFVWAFGLVLPMFIAAILWIAGDIMGVFGIGGSDVGYIAHLSGVGVGIIFGLFLRVLKKKVRDIKSKVKIPEFYMKNWEDRYVK